MQKYGGSKVTAEIAKKEMDAMNKEPLVQHAPRVAKRQLEWLAPMISLYRQLPHFNKWIEGLEAAAAGDFGRLPIPGDL